MKDFFSRSWLIVILAAVLLALIMGICSALSGGRISPISNLFNILATPLQSASTSISNGVGGFFEKLTDYDKLDAENEELRKNEFHIFPSLFFSMKASRSAASSFVSPFPS